MKYCHSRLLVPQAWRPPSWPEVHDPIRGLSGSLEWRRRNGDECRCTDGQSASRLNSPGGCAGLTSFSMEVVFSGRPLRQGWRWTMPITPLSILGRLYGDQMRVHEDLHRASNAHRRSHRCDVYPSDLAQAPLWPLLATLVHPRRFLEIGCGLGYTAALMATAGGPGCRVDTIEANPLHADLAERAFAVKGLSSRIRVHRGSGKTVLPGLRGPYDVVFLDSDWQDYPRYLSHLVRLTRRGSVVVSANLFPLFGRWGNGPPGKNSVRAYLRGLIRDSPFRTYIVRGDWHAISVRV